jgi:predicted Zn-dependent protease
MRKALLLLSAAAIAAAPVSGSAQVRTLDPKDVAEAQQQDAALIAEFGGAETGPRAAYTSAVGRRVAVQSSVANAANAYHFTLLNSAVENAFSLPGGYVYMTRQLMTLMDDESQLAFALGHEVGHIAANHAELREHAARPSVLSVLGAIIGGVFGDTGFGNYISQAAQVRSQLSLLQ